jgi:hypothetical protein
VAHYEKLITSESDIAEIDRGRTWGDLPGLSAPLLEDLTLLAHSHPHGIAKSR